MTRAQASYDRYRSDHRAFESSLAADGPAWLHAIRQRGLESFNRLGFPTATRGNERWKYTNVTPLANVVFEYPFDVDANGISALDIKELAPWDETWTRLVFIDGSFSPTLSTGHLSANGLIAANLVDSISEESELVEKYLGRMASAEDDGFAAINTAHLRDGAFVHVPDGSSPDSPLHLVFLTTDRPKATVSYPRSLITVGRHSRLTVVESYVSLSHGPYLTDTVVEIVAGEGAEIDHFRYLMESPDAFHIGTTRVNLGPDSTFKSTSFARGARLARNDISVLLDAPGSSCYLKGLYFTSGTQHIDNHITIDHARPHTTSDLFFKGILNDKSRAVFSGGVLVRKDAQKTNARQADKNLILSEGARVNTKPSLEIFADDVQCTHGATAGAVAEEALFYMRSRGLDEETARTLLVSGFASEIIDGVHLQPLQDTMNRLFSGTLPGFNAMEAA